MKLLYAYIWVLVNLSNISHPVELTRLVTLEDIHCPVGYAFTTLKPTAQETLHMMLHQLSVQPRCDQTPRYDFPLNGIYSIIYTCQKITNHWAGTLLTGRRG